MLGGKEIVGRTWEGDRESGLEEREEKIVKYGPLRTRIHVQKKLKRTWIQDLHVANLFPSKPKILIYFTNNNYLQYDYYSQEIFFLSRFKKPKSQGAQFLRYNFYHNFDVFGFKW